MISAQLSLFDTATVIEPTYKVGDRVKVKRKTPHAPLLKKGDIVRIEAIHPHNGSCKFWNELTESWGYLYPEEFALLPPGNDDSVTPVEVAVTESPTPESANDFVTPVEVAVTESSTPESADYVSAVSIYKPRGTARGKEYYRLSYKLGGKVRHIHIRGGNTDSPIAQAKVAEVRSLLSKGVPVSEVAALLKTNN